RALELFRCGDRTVEMAFGGRDLGKVNINTIWDKPVFDAIFDAPRDPITGLPINTYDATKGFTQKDVDDAWKAMMGLTTTTPLPPNDPARTRQYYLAGQP